METDHYIGIDLHKAFLQVCAMAKTGERQWESRFPRTPEGIGALVARCTASSAIAVEATTTSTPSTFAAAWLKAMRAPSPRSRLTASLSLTSDPETS